LSGSVIALDHAFLTIPEGTEDEARRFYGQLLGLEEMSRPEGLRDSHGVWFRAGAQELHLGSDAAHAAARRPHPGFRLRSIDELDELASRLAAGGFAVEWDERIEGRKRFYTRDPFGNRIELLAERETFAQTSSGT
jgi:catechol 2,3-dioxygenase-like lactoylglutathione lyase family enzyme